MNTSEVHKLPSIYKNRDEIVKVKNKEVSETTRLIGDMAADKKVVVSDTGLCNFWAITWLAAWYIFSGITKGLQLSISSVVEFLLQDLPCS